MMKIKAREAFSLTERLKARMNLNFTARRLFMAWVYRQQMISVATALLLY